MLLKHTSPIRKLHTIVALLGAARAARSRKLLLLAAYLRATLLIQDVLGRALRTARVAPS